MEDEVNVKHEISDWTDRFRGTQGVSLNPENVTKYWNNQTPYSGTNKFTDSLFPADRESILSSRGLWNKNHQDQLVSYQFDYARPETFLNTEDYVVFDDKVTFSDVKQGYLGDCYYLAALAALTEFPGLINSNFKNGGARSQNGYYEILMFIDEEWQIVIVDDLIPRIQGHRRPCFADSDPRNVIWPMLLEKAWAKINGGYANITGGKSCWPFHILTGFPSSIYYNQQFRNKDDLWRLLKSCDRRSEIMVSGSCKQGNGIVPGHAYTLISVTEIDNDSEPLRLVCLRNPWGRGEWSGDYSDDSNTWTPELRKKLNVVRSNDGIFWMSFDDYFDYYNELNVAHSPNYFKGINIFSHTDHLPKVYNLLANGPITLSTNIITHNSDFPVSIFICNYGNYNMKNVNSCYIYQNNSGTIHNLHSGHYLVGVYPHEDSGKPYQVRFSCNGNYILKSNYSYDKEHCLLSHIKSMGLEENYTVLKDVISLIYLIVKMVQTIAIRTFVVILTKDNSQ